MTFERNDGIWISYIYLDRIPHLCTRYWDSFLSHCCSSIICTSEPLLVILCDTLFWRSKWIFFTIESAETCMFLYIKDASFSRRILLKLIHLKSRNIVGWRGLVLNISDLCQFSSKVNTFSYFTLQFFTAFTPYWTTIV